MQKVTDNVFVETGFHGCNTSLVVTREGVVVIDTPMVPDESKRWRDEAAKHGNIRYVINTEPHADHATGNCWFGAPVIAHEGTRKELEGAKVDDLKNSLKMMAPDSPPLDTAFFYRLPEITFSQNLTFYLGDHTFQLINLPGHTASETAVYVPREKVVFSGDNLNLHMPIFIKSLPFAWLESLKQMEKLDAAWFVPGHGEVSGKGCLSSMAEGVNYFINAVKEAIDKGYSLEETLAKVTMKERYPFADNPMMSGMIRNSVADLYHSLKK